MITNKKMNIVFLAIMSIILIAGIIAIVLVVVYKKKNNNTTDTTDTTDTNQGDNNDNTKKTCKKACISPQVCIEGDCLCPNMGDTCTPNCPCKSGQTCINGMCKNYTKLDKNYLYGDNIIDGITGDLYYCSRYCDATKGCIGFTRDTTSDTDVVDCNLKSSATKVIKSSTDNITSYMKTVDPKNYSSKGGHDIFGYDQESYDYINDISECKDYCSSSSGCVSFTNDSSDKTCHIKQTCKRDTNGICNPDTTDNTNLTTYYRTDLPVWSTIYNKNINKDIPGQGQGDIGSIDGLNAQDCSDYCSNLDTCIGFVRRSNVADSQDDTCWFKRRGEAGLTDNNSLTSYTLKNNPFNNFTQMNSTDIHGYDYTDGAIASMYVMGNNVGMTGNDCLNLCLNTSECMAVVYDKNNQTCLLKKGITTSPSSDNMVTLIRK